MFLIHGRSALYGMSIYPVPATGNIICGMCSCFKHGLNASGNRHDFVRSNSGLLD
jgi:hypothetical protein